MWTEQSIKVFKQIIKWVKLVFTPLALIFIIYFAWISRELLFQLFANAHLYRLCLCILIWICLHALSPVFTTKSFQALNNSFNFKNALYIHTTNLPAKYLPGGIWHSVARSHEYHNNGVAISKVGLYLLHENLLVAAVTLFLGGALLGFAEVDERIRYIAIFLSMLSIVFILIWPWILSKLQNKFKETIRIKAYASAVGSMISYWIIASLSFVLFLNAFPDLHFSHNALHIAGAYIFSWGIGFITIFAPQGLGVSEYVVSEILSSGIGSPGLIALLASFRIIILIADFTTWLLACLLKFYLK